VRGVGELTDFEAAFDIFFKAAHRCGGGEGFELSAS
jgi:hypothetical protein